MVGLPTPNRNSWKVCAAKPNERRLHGHSPIPPRPVQWSSSSTMFTAHPHRPTVIVRHFSSSRQYELPAPEPLKPGIFEPPGSILVHPNGDAVFAFFPGRQIAGIGVIWHRLQPVDVWNPVFYHPFPIAAGVVGGQWLNSSRRVRKPLCLILLLLLMAVLITVDAKLIGRTISPSPAGRSRSKYRPLTAAHHRRPSCMCRLLCPFSARVQSVKVFTLATCHCHRRSPTTSISARVDTGSTMCRSRGRTPFLR